MTIIPANTGETRLSSAAVRKCGMEEAPLRDVGAFYLIPRACDEAEAVNPLAGLYDGTGCALDGEQPPLVLGDTYFLGLLAERPAGAVLTSRPFMARDLELIWMLPLDAEPAPPPRCILALIVQALDGGGAVALHASDQTAIEAVKRTVLPLVGGGWA